MPHGPFGACYGCRCASQPPTPRRTRAGHTLSAAFVSQELLPKMVEMQLRDTDLMSLLRTIMLSVQTYRQLRFSTTRVVARLIDCHMATIQQNDVLCRGLSLCMGILDKHRRAAEDEADESLSSAQDFFTLVLKLTPPLLQRTCDASPGLRAALLAHVTSTNTLILDAMTQVLKAKDPEADTAL